MTLKIISAEDIVFEGKVTAVHLPGTMGEFTVLRNHASLISSLVPGTIKYQEEGSDEVKTVETGGGIVDVDKNVVSVCIY
ncbi:MAG: F0F1 ATP synthase subunit epsilon [Muribaculaceae bacterium]|nr:F0F1 ATP synthase subunit epsilon [Muribaculaceae bacterium]